MEQNELISQAKERSEEVGLILERMELLIESAAADSRRVSSYSDDIHDRLIDLEAEYKKILKYQSRSTELLDIIRKYLRQLNSDQKEFFQSLLNAKEGDSNSLEKEEG